MFRVYGKTECVWCDRVKEVLDSFGKEYEFLNIETDPVAMTLFKGYFPGAKTVPQVLDPEDNWIGGFIETANWLGVNGQSSPLPTTSL